LTTRRAAGLSAEGSLAAQLGGQFVGMHPRRVVGRHHLIPFDLDPVGLLAIEDDRQIAAGLRPLFGPDLEVRLAGERSTPGAWIT
jgi:hypothetical protein